MKEAETYRFQYEQWHQDTPESREVDIKGSADFIEAHGIWPAKKDAHIFDVGCGMGRFLLAFRGRGYENLGGIDIDDYQVMIAKKEKLDVSLVDANKYFENNRKKYDLVTMIDCLEHVEKEDQICLLRSIERSVNSEGSIVIRVPNALAPAISYLRYIDFTHKLAYTEESLGYVLKNAGFHYIAFRPAWNESGAIARQKAEHANLLKAEFGLSNPILTSNIVAVAFKSKKAYDKYISTAPVIDINYAIKKAWWKKILSR